MTTNGFAGKQFQTAAFRRRGKPLLFQVQGWVTTDDEMAAWLAAFDVDGEPDEGPGHEDTVTLMVDPLLDLVRLGAAFGGFGTALQNVGNADLADEDKLKAIDVQLPRVKQALRDCLVPPSRLKFDTVSDAIDVTRLGELVRWITTELSGLDPTPPNESSAGADTTGSSSTAGAPPEASTSAPSLLPAG